MVALLGLLRDVGAVGRGGVCGHAHVVALLVGVGPGGGGHGRGGVVVGHPARVQLAVAAHRLLFLAVHGRIVGEGESVGVGAGRASSRRGQAHVRAAHTPPSAGGASQGGGQSGDVLLAVLPRVRVERQRHVTVLRRYYRVLCARCIFPIASEGALQHSAGVW